MFLRSFLRPETAFFLLVSIGFQFAFRERGFFDPGSLWHVRVGDIILESGFPHTDPFTYTHAGKVWIPQQWGAEVMMSLAYRYGGFDTMLLGFSVTLATMFTWMFARMRAAGMHTALAGVLTGLCLFSGGYHYFIRPHMFTLAFTVLTMAWLVDFDRGRASVGKLVWFIPIFIVWTNIHGGVIGGIMMLGLCLAGWIVLFLLRHSFPRLESPFTSRRELILLSFVGIACLFTPIVNPFGMEMLNTWQRIVGSKVIKTVIAEHQPLNLRNSADQAIFGFGVLYVFMLAGTLPRMPRVTWLIPLVWFALTFDGIRQGPLFAVSGGMVMADFLPHTLWYRLLKKYGDSLIQFPPDPTARITFRGMLIPILFVSACLGLQVNNVQVPVIGRGWARINDDVAPHEFTELLHQYAAEKGPDARILNDANLGGYLIFYLPEMKIFMDDRFELYGDEWTKNYAETIFEKNPEQIEEWADKYDLDLALFIDRRKKSEDSAANSNQDDETLMLKYLAASPRWKKLGQTKCAVLYRRVKANP